MLAESMMTAGNETWAVYMLQYITLTSSEARSVRPRIGRYVVTSAKSCRVASQPRSCLRGSILRTMEVHVAEQPAFVGRPAFTLVECRAGCLSRLSRSLSGARGSQCPERRNRQCHRFPSSTTNAEKQANIYIFFHHTLHIRYV
jgi:hypothetical protein